MFLSLPAKLWVVRSNPARIDGGSLKIDKIRLIKKQTEFTEHDSAHGRLNLF
jgi:hypothetical protein